MAARTRIVELTMETADVVDNLHLDAIRTLNRSHVADPLDRCRVLAAFILRLEDWKEREALVASDGGAGYAALGRALGVSRQAARQWVQQREG